MIKQRWKLHLVLGLILVHTISAASDQQGNSKPLALPDEESDPLIHYQAPTSFGDPIEPVSRVRKRKRPHYGPRMQSIWSDIFKDIVVLNRNLFLWHSFTVIS